MGDLQLAQFQVGDCLTGSNMDLNTNTPWPKITLAVPCSQSHTAEVFYANSEFWAKGGAYPGDSTISKDANAECDNAFSSYVGIAYSKSMYTWTNIVPDASTWPTGDRALHCVAYYATPKQPAGALSPDPSRARASRSPAGRAGRASGRDAAAPAVIARYERSRRDAAGPG